MGKKMSLSMIVTLKPVRVTCEELELTLNLSVEDNFQPVRIHKVNGKTEFTMLLIEFMS